MFLEKYFYINVSYRLLLKLPLYGSASAWSYFISKLITGVFLNSVSLRPDQSLRFCLDLAEVTRVVWRFYFMAIQTGQPAD